MQIFLVSDWSDWFYFRSIRDPKLNFKIIKSQNEANYDVADQTSINIRQVFLFWPIRAQLSFVFISDWSKLIRLSPSESEDDGEYEIYGKSKTYLALEVKYLRGEIDKLASRPIYSRIKSIVSFAILYMWVIYLVNASVIKIFRLIAGIIGLIVWLIKKVSSDGSKIYDLEPIGQTAPFQTAVSAPVHYRGYSLEPHVIEDFSDFNQEILNLQSWALI